ncbi:MAG: cyanophycin synthetase, partial [Cyanobacteriota bacterium]|nr:cyanophycin synthetase [Cyanobacteriota bacterium]
PLVAAMAKQVKAKVAYFSMQPDNDILQTHLRQGGLAAIYDRGYITIMEGDWQLRVEEAKHIPVTMGGMAPFMIANALAACLAAFACGVDIEQIRQGLRTFEPSAAQTPGRMNLFNLGGYHALLDYAHNPASYEALSGFVRNWPGERLGVIGGPGDRRDEDLIALGELSAKMFDRIIIKEDRDRRGREEGEVAALIVEGVRRAKTDVPCTTILDEAEAVRTGLNEAKEGSLVTILPESVSSAIALIEERQTVSEKGLPQETTASISH